MLPRLLYNLLIIPILWLGFLGCFPFIRKVRQGMLGRIGWRKRLRKWAQASPSGKPFWLFHVASVGELEAIRPVIDRIVKRGTQRIIVTVFSPSAHKAKPSLPGIDLLCYLPFDSIFNQRLLLKTIKPQLVVISKHDVWPNLLVAAHELKIPTALINANFHPNSLRIHPAFRFFHRWVFSEFSGIAAVSHQHAERLTSLVGNGFPCQVLGDTRYDRVRERCHRHSPTISNKANQFADRMVVVVGSSHPTEEQMLIPLVAELIRPYPKLFIIWVPHDPEPSILVSLEQQLQTCSLLTRRWSEDWILDDITGMVVDQVGILAELYSLGNIAIVGGGFDKGVHSVIEPAVFGLPVLFGPHYHVSQEANYLVEKGGGLVFQNREELFEILRSLLENPEKCRLIGENAKSVIEQNLGASDRIVNFLDNLIND